MLRTMGLGVAIGLSVIAAAPPHASMTPAACQLLTLQEASKMMGGMQLSVDPGDALGGPHCRYYKPTAPPADATLAPADGVEITYRAFSDVGSAHAFFPRWVIPFPPKPASMDVHSVPSVGDTAVIVSSPASKSIYFQRGAVLVKMGTRPPGLVTDDALAAAAKTMVSRM
jgi:hypothetical protein